MDGSTLNAHQQAVNTDEFDNMSYSTLFPDISIFEEDEKEEKEAGAFIATEWGLKKIGTLQSRLESLESKRGGRRFFGVKFEYSSFLSHILINLANETFGYDGWSSEILECILVNASCHQATENSEARHSVHFMSRVRVTLQDGTVCDGMGKGEATNMPHKYMCYSKAKKQAVTDAIKNAIIGFYDKLILQEVGQLTSESDPLLFLQNDVRVKIEDD